MNNYEWLMYASIVVWAGLGFYVFSLARKQIALSKRINQMSQLARDDFSGDNSHDPR